MSVLLGKIDHFYAEVEEWAKYVEKLEHFFKANDITGRILQVSTAPFFFGPNLS